MKQIGSILLKGLVTILPIGLTVYFVYWLGITTEGLLSRPIKAALGVEHYWPGMGLITGFVLLFLIGLAVNQFLVRRLLDLGEELLLRVPVVKAYDSRLVRAWRTPTLPWSARFQTSSEKFSCAK